MIDDLVSKGSEPYRMFILGSIVCFWADNAYSLLGRRRAVYQGALRCI